MNVVQKDVIEKDLIQNKVMHKKVIQKKVEQKRGRYHRLAGILLALMFIFSGLTIYGAEKSEPSEFRDLTVDEIVYEMGTGINLGNTFDGHTGLEPNETLWQNVKTSQDYMTAIHDLGINTIRIPVTWGKMIHEDFTIKEEWISRVQDVVDYAIAEDMYVIINIHHDGAEQSGWLLVESDHPEAVLQQFAGVWKSIASYFKDYDEHLIFESMNEVWGHSQTIQEDMEMINKLNQAFVNVVRNSGGNNGQRWLSVPGRYTNIGVNTDPKNGFKLPNDTIANRIFVSVHDYPMGMGLTQTMNATVFSEIDGKNFVNKMQKLVDAFTSKGIPVILGEYGTMNKNNTIEREYYYEVVNTLCKVAGVVPIAWDMGAYDLSLQPDYSMTLIDRETGEPVYPTIIEAMLRGIQTKTDDLSVEGVIKPTLENPREIISIEDVILSEENLSLTIGEKFILDSALEPANANEAVVWKSENSKIATVSNGIVIGKGIGQTSILISTLDGRTLKRMDVQVNPSQETIPCDSIIVNSSHTVEEDGYTYLYAKVGTEACEDFLTYNSSDASIASVNSFGKVTGIKAGSCEIIITASSGFSKVVKLTVLEKKVVSEITIGLNVYFNETELEYYGNELGETITVNGDGLYKLTLDLSEHLSATGQEKGVMGLNNVGAIYIKDVASGLSLKSCDILYKEIMVDGQVMTVIQTEAKSALKDSGIFDTNDPVNAWDGSQIEEIDWNKDKFNINFKGLDHPQKIEVVFELSNMQFVGNPDKAGQGNLNLYVMADDAATEEEDDSDSEVDQGNESSQTKEEDQVNEADISDKEQENDSTKDTLEKRQYKIELYIVLGLVVVLTLGIYIYVKGKKKKSN